MRFYVAGSRNVPGDGVALDILPLLADKFMGHEFIEYDPNEELEGEEIFIIDAVKGIGDRVAVLGEGHIGMLEDFPKVSAHDFDLTFRLKLMLMLGKVRRVVIIGIPYGMEKMKAFNEVSEVLEKIISS